MQIQQVLVDRRWFRRLRANASKLGALEYVLASAAATTPRTNLVVLPAGFLTAKSRATIPACVAAVAKLALHHRVAVVFGVDLPRAKGGAEERARVRRVKQSSLPYWGFVIDQNGQTLGAWRQQSSHSADAGTAPALAAQKRIVTLGSKTIAVMLCGEIFNANYRTAMRAEAFDVLIDIGHKSMNTGVVPALKNIVDGRQRWALHTHHVKVGDAKAHAIAPGGLNVGIRSTGGWRRFPANGWLMFTTTRTI